MINTFRRVEADIDLDAIRYNIETVKALNPADKKVALVIKADAYGHGSVALAKEFEDLADYFAVATIDEALELRHAGVHKDILILGYTSPEDYRDAVMENITLTMYSKIAAKELSKVAASCGRFVKVHIKVDTGMGRIGFQCINADVENAAMIDSLPGIEVEGIFTHYAKADYYDKRDAITQLENFRWFVDAVEKKGVKFKYKHIDNSAGSMEIHSEGFNMMRLGIVIYGLYPSEEIDKSVVIKPAMTLKSRVIHVKTLPAGRGIGYGWTYVTNQPTRVATVSVGYADGYPRALSGYGRVLIHGMSAPIIGKVCMDQIMIDVSEVEDATDLVRVGDEVVLFGKQGEELIPVEEVAEPANSFNYEAVCNISRRVPRVYFKGGEEVGEVNYLKI